MELKEMTLYGAVKSTAKTYPKNTALYYMGVNISYARLVEDIDAIAGWFASRGIKEGDVVTLCMPNIPQCVVCFYALSKLGAVAHMVHPLAPETQLSEYMDEVGSKMLVLPDIMAKKYPTHLAGEREVLLCSPAHYLGFVKRAIYGVSVRKETSGLNEYASVSRYESAIKHKSDVTEFKDAEATAVYLHSGGTSGKPKTIELSSRSINALTATSHDILGVKKEQLDGISMLAVLPMFHGFGLAMGVHAALVVGGYDVLMPKFKTKETIKLIAKNKIKCMIGVPTLYRALLNRPEFDGEMLKNLLVAFVGGDYVPTQLLADFNERMAKNGSKALLLEGYGLTETVTVCSVNKLNEHKKGSIGKPILGVTITAFSDGKPLPPMEIGELCIAGDTLMNAYLNDTEGTKAVFFDYEGTTYVNSGDMGYVDEEGYVFFKSRVKRMAKVSGIPIFPSEIERLCMDTVDEVREACAAAVPDEKLGNAIVLFVTLNAQAEDIESKLCDLIEDKLSVYARPRKVVIVDAFPQTLVGKIDVNKLVETHIK